MALGGGAATAYTLLIYLSGGLTGGETVFYGEQLLLIYHCLPLQTSHAVLPCIGKCAFCHSQCVSSLASRMT